MVATRNCTLENWNDNSDLSFCNVVEAGSWVALEDRFAHALLQFDVIDALPAHSVVRTATLNVYPIQPSQDYQLSAFAVQTPWTDQATWNNAGDHDPAAALDTEDSGAQDAYRTWDVTSAVTAWLNGTAPQDGLLLMSPNDDNQDSLVDFYSLQDAADVRPYVGVNYAVDDTAPEWPGLIANPSAVFDPDTATTDVSWNYASDPVLSDGGPGSGVAGYNYRVMRAGGAWSSWTTTSTPWISLASSYSNESIGLEIQAYDAFGNTSPTVSSTLTAAETTVTADNFGDADANETGDVGDDIEPTDLVDGNGDSAPPAGGDEQALAQADYTETLCPGGGPCGTYDGGAAAAYALHWQEADSWLKRDRKWSYYGGNGGDCTNFASAALYAGDMRFMGAEGHNSPDASDPADTTHFHFVDEASWFSYFTQVLPGNLHYHPTASFVRSNDLFHHLLDYGMAEVVAGSAKVHRGDLVFYRGATGGYHHTQVVTRVEGSKAFVSQHSPSYYHSLRYIKDKYRNRGKELGVDYFITILHPKYTKANIG